MGRLPVIFFFGLILTMSEYSCDDNPVTDISILILQINEVSHSNGWNLPYHKCVENCWIVVLNIKHLEVVYDSVTTWVISWEVELRNQYAEVQIKH